MPEQKPPPRLPSTIKLFAEMQRQLVGSGYNIRVMINPPTDPWFMLAYFMEVVGTLANSRIGNNPLHIEDTETTYEELVKEFNQDVADLVMEVTQEGQADWNGFYFPRLKTQRGIMLKFADRLSNLSSMDAWPEKRRQQYLRKSKFWKSEIVAPSNGKEHV